jgi:tRNA(Leu) C34 or U34 (ribose-2'-O)-methylase TrmL
MRQTAAEMTAKAVVAWTRVIHLDAAKKIGHRAVSPEVSLRLALFEPDIPQNTGALLRLAACFGIAVDLIEPCGFLLDDRRLRRTALDYAAICPIVRHASWGAFLANRDPRSRVLLMTTSGAVTLHRFAFEGNDTILLGRESAGFRRRCTPLRRRE